MKTTKAIIASTLIALASIALTQAQTQITITLTAEQEAALTAAVAVINPERAAQEPPGVQVTVASYAAELFQSKLVSIVRQWKSRITAEVLAKYEAAPAKAREDAVKVLEGKATVDEVSIIPKDGEVIDSK